MCSGVVLKWFGVVWCVLGCFQGPITVKERTDSDVAPINYCSINLEHLSTTILVRLHYSAIFGW